jgi:mannosyl-oligosaccharide alpha-1,2-mannosidase
MMSLDTLWIMGLRKEFDEAVHAVDAIDFSTCAGDEINVFETTIRYLGGFLAAYDLSGNERLKRKAVEMGDLLYKAFDTPNRMPITRWKFKDAAEGRPQVAPDSTLIAEIGSLTLEFTRLSQVTGDPKYYDAVQRVMDVMEAQQDLTNLPGMWPVIVNPKTMEFNVHGGFTLGGMADSAYEYLPKVRTPFLLAYKR